MTLRELLQKDSDGNLLCEMIGFAAQRPMKLETEPLCGAAQPATLRTNPSGQPHSICR